MLYKWRKIWRDRDGNVTESCLNSIVHCEAVVFYDPRSHTVVCTDGHDSRESIKLSLNSVGDFEFWMGIKLPIKKFSIRLN